MRRSPLGLEAVADWHNLAAAFHRAALGRSTRPEVQRFAARLETELAHLRTCAPISCPAASRWAAHAGFAFTIRSPAPFMPRAFANGCCTMP
jgi:hypothetical protein